MPRPQRLNLVGIPQHITQRGNNRQACFFKGTDRLAYLAILHHAAKSRRCLVHAYVLMTNHVHLLVTPLVADAASRLMQDVGREYVRYINSSYQRTGTLWEGLFKSSLVDSAHYCLVCYRYIELNPVRAEMVTAPGDYRWSSYAYNAMGHADEVITPHELWIALGPNPESRCEAYRALFNDVSDTSQIDQIRYANRKGLPLGTDEFKTLIESELGRKLGTGRVGRPPSSD